jgi:hypothetical protein
MIINVFHKSYNAFGQETGYEHVANVYPPMHNDINEALEYAYRYTQNLDGSWSMGEMINDYSNPMFMIDNPDYNPDIEVVKPISTYNGRPCGHRSSSVGDIFIIAGVNYEVASFGFKEIEEENLEEKADRFAYENILEG